MLNKKKMIANILNNLFLSICDNITTIEDAIKSKEFELFSDLFDSIKNNDCKRNICKDCDNINYDITINIWLTFYTQCDELNKSNYDLINYIKNNFNLHDNRNFFILTDQILNASEYINKSLDKKYIEQYNKYIKDLNELFNNFKLSVSNFNLADNKDEIYNISHIEPTDLIFYNEVKKDKKIAYLDQNTISYLVSDKNLLKQYINYKEKNEIQFVYSPYVIHDAIIMNPFFFKEYTITLKELTNNHMIACTPNHGFCLVTEDLEKTINRVNIYKEASYYNEKSIFHECYQNYITYPFLRKNSELSKIINENITSFFENYFIEKNKDEPYYLIIMNFLYNRCSFSIEELKNGKINNNDNYDRTINELVELLDFLNFHSESLSISISNKNKIMSGYRDKMHLIHAHVSDVFITKDKRLKKRGDYIYSLLGLDIKILTVDEFKKEYIEKFYK